MRDAETITVGYDASRSAQRAAEWAAREAEVRSTVVRLIACYSAPVVAEPWYVPAAVPIEDVREDAQRHAEAVLDRLRRGHPSLSFDTRVELGPPAERLIAAADDSALVILGTHGHGPLGSWRLGSVSHAVARRARCPVVVVPDVEPRPRRARVVAGIDGSPMSHAALRWACDEADLRDAELLVAHVWDYPYAIEGASTARDLFEIDAALHLEVAMRLALERRRGPTNDVLRSGSAATVLCELADDADLLVVGSRGRNPVRTLLFGSVSQAVSARSSCPVVIVRQGDFIKKPDGRRQ